MLREERIELKNPVEKKAGQMVTELTLRRPTVGDEEDAMDNAILLGKENNRITLEICTYAKLTGLKYETLRTMDPDDFVKIRNAYARLLSPLALKEETQEEEKTKETQVND